MSPSASLSPSASRSPSASASPSPDREILGVGFFEICFTTGYSDNYLGKSTPFIDLYIDPFKSVQQAHANTPSIPTPGNQVLSVDLIDISFGTGYSEEYLTQSTNFTDEYIDPFKNVQQIHTNVPSTPSVGSEILSVDLVDISFGTGYSDRYSPQNTPFSDLYGQSC